MFRAAFQWARQNDNVKENSNDNTNGEQSFNGSNENERGREERFAKISTEE